MKFPIFEFQTSIIIPLKFHMTTRDCTCQVDIIIHYVLKWSVQVHLYRSVQGYFAYQGVD